MDFLQFVNAVKIGLKQYFDEETEFIVKSVRKNNGVMLTGIVILEKGSHIAPTIYLESFYEEYRKDNKIQEVLLKLVQVYEKNKIEPCIELDFFKDYEKTKYKISYKLINAQKNTELLKEIPFVPYLDLAIVFYCDCSSELFGNASILIKNSHLEMWGVDVEKVYRAAVENTPKNNPFEIKSMETVIKELYIEGIRKELEKNHIPFSKQEMEQMASRMLEKERTADEKTPMYVLTNVERTHGASCILYHNLLEEFAKKVNDNLYILPSSIHEIIMIPASYAGKASELKAMVKEINKTQVEEEEVLSDSVYFFNRLTKKLELA